MALTTLTSLTQAQWDNLSKTLTTPQPNKTSDGAPFKDVEFFLFSCTQTPGVLAFKMNAPLNTTLSISMAADTLKVNRPSDASANREDTFWTVNMSKDVCGGAWNIQYDTGSSAPGRTDKGKWVFTKGVG